MVNLWYRENRKGPAIYVDLFEDVETEYEEEFKEWDQQLNSSNWPHRFLHFENDAVKNETVARMFDSQGNVYFQRNEFHQAMEMYNQALCFARSNSSRLGILFMKRGFCFFRLGMYVECMEDMELALQTDFPIAWMDKLNEYQANCMKQMSTAIQRAPIALSLSFPADRTFPCIANVISIRQGLEPYIVATTDIDVGQIILIEKAFASIAVGYDTAFCITCKKMCKNLFPCAYCVDVMFCSMKCQELNEVHCLTCGDTYNRMPSYIKLVVQSILEAITAFSTIDDLMTFVKSVVARKDHDIRINEKISNYGLFIGLKMSSKPPPIQLIYQAYTTLMAMRSIQSRFITKSNQRFLMHLVGHHTQILLNNSYGGLESNQNQFIYASMTNVASLFQHSCTPNLIQHSVGNQTIFITNQLVKQGDRLYVDFCPEETVSENRKEMLRQEYGIFCNCSKCNPEQQQQPMTNPMLSNDPTLLYIIRYKNFIGSGTSALLKQKCISFLRQYKDEPWCKEKEYVIDAYTKCISEEFRQ